MDCRNPHPSPLLTCPAHTTLLLHSGCGFFAVLIIGVMVFGSNKAKQIRIQTRCFYFTYREGIYSMNKHEDKCLCKSRSIEIFRSALEIDFYLECCFFSFSATALHRSFTNLKIFNLVRMWMESSNLLCLKLCSPKYPRKWKFRKIILDLEQFFHLVQRVHLLTRSSPGETHQACPLR